MLAFSFYFGYFAANFYPRHYLLLPLSVMLGALAGPMWSAQATYVTTLALTFAQHRRLAESSDETINKFMGIFFGFFRSSQIWGNIISALVLAKNDTEPGDFDANFSSYSSLLQGGGGGGGGGGGVYSHNNSSSSSSSSSSIGSNDGDNSGRFRHLVRDSYSASGGGWEEEDKYFTSSSRLMSAAARNASEALCGVSTCLLNRATGDGIYSNPELGPGASLSGGGAGGGGGGGMIPESTKYMLLITCLGCGLMGIVIVVALVDHVNVGKRNADPEYALTSWELCLSTLRMLKDSKCCLLVPLVLFMGLEQGFLFSDFTKVRVLGQGRGGGGRGGGEGGGGGGRG